MDETERNLLELRSRVNALERVIASLVATHADPAAFASNLERAVELVTARHLHDERVSDDLREHQRRVALEYADLARDYAARAAAHAPRGD